MGGLAIDLCDTLGKILEIRIPYPQREEEEYDEYRGKQHAVCAGTIIRWRSST
jgi:hypothetical protein